MYMRGTPTHMLAALSLYTLYSMSIIYSLVLSIGLNALQCVSVARFALGKGAAL